LLFGSRFGRDGELPPTLMTITPRGGRHLIFAWDNGAEIRNSTSKPKRKAQARRTSRK